MLFLDVISSPKEESFEKVCHVPDFCRIALLIRTMCQKQGSKGTLKKTVRIQLAPKGLLFLLNSKPNVFSKHKNLCHTDSLQ